MHPRSGGDSDLPRPSPDAPACLRGQQPPVPYVICPACGLTTYSAALWSSVDCCPRCGFELPSRRPARVIPLAWHPRFAAGPGAGGVRRRRGAGARRFRAG
jgi:hypothetical protein